jgi:hypothetical protein
MITPIAELSAALAAVLADVDNDHWQIARAFNGEPSTCPRDPARASMHRVILNSAWPLTVFDLLQDHTDTALEHAQWAFEWLHLAPTPVPLSARTTKPRWLQLAS